MFIWIREGQKMISYYEALRDVQDKLVILEMENVKAEPHFHRCIELLFVKEGELEISSAKQKRVFKKGEIAFIRLYSVHSVHADSSFSDTLLIPERYFADASVACDLGFFALDDVAYNKKLFDIENEIKKRLDCGAEFMLEGLVSVLLGYIAEKYRPCESYPAETQLMSGIIEWLDANFTQTITLSLAAKHFGFSKYHFSRLFNKLFGCNFTVYLNRVRARYVRENEGKGKSITALIYEAGFGCTSAYYQFLKREKSV